MIISKEKKFLRELSKISERYGLYIGGCGCFGSPHVYDDKNQVVMNNLRYRESRYDAEENTKGNRNRNRNR